MSYDRCMKWIEDLLKEGQDKSESLKKIFELLGLTWVWSDLQ